MLSAPPRRPVRVCFLIDALTRAGTETQLLALIRELDRSRVEPLLCLLNGESLSSRALEPTDCPVLRLGVQSLARPAALPGAARLAQFLRRRRVDVLQTYFLDSTYFGVPVARASGVPRVVRVRNNLGHWLTPAHRRLGRLIGRFVDVTVTNCEPARQALLAAEGGAPDKVVVLENGVDLARFDVSRAPDTGGAGVRIGAVANLRPVKAIDLFVCAAARLAGAHPGVYFSVAGEGEERPVLERLVAERGLAGRFELPGAVADVPAFLAGLDVAVLCSHAEGMSNALLEYMAGGRAIVATDVGANGRLIRDGEHGLLVRPGDETALAAGIDRLLRDPALARRLGAAARERVRVEHSRAAMRERFQEFYERLCRRPEGRRAAA